MSKLRQDAWLKENDELLAETVIRHVREGSTQLNAFEEVSDMLNRTAAACGFRWNAVVRRLYEQQLLEAKQQRKERIRLLGNMKRRHIPPFYQKEDGEQPQQIPLSSLSLDIVIAYLLRLQQGYTNEHELAKWKHIVQIQTDKIAQLQQEVSILQEENRTVKQDYEQFVQIINRARKLVVLEEENEKPSPTFKMERNGNLIPTLPALSNEEENLL